MRVLCTGRRLNMDAYECLISRRSYRSFTNKRVPHSCIEKIVYAGQCAPTGMDRQPLAFVVVEDTETMALLSKWNAQVMGVDTDPFYGAGQMIIVFADPSVPTYMNDGSLAMGNLLNAACAFGVNACWIHRAKEIFESEGGKKLKRKWNIPENFEGIGHCILGYSDQKLKEKKITSKVVWDPSCE
ncbi:MAG: nitroreductase family protein [Erysipelotrichaceae bacterium]|nr:nitroreductase family protein [Erysipelotrichaceae bacterium]